MVARATTLLSVLLPLFLLNVEAFTQSSSAFSGKGVFVTDRIQRQPQSARGDLTMKKGKANVPPNMRSQYKRQQELGKMRDQMQAAQNPGADGFPVFNLFVRTKRANMWYPCGSFKGDERSMALAQSWRDGGLLSGVSKNQLDAGVSGSLFRDLDQLKETIARAYPQLRKSKDELEFGYKLAFDGLDEEQRKICFIEPKERNGFLDNISSIFGN